MGDVDHGVGRRFRGGGDEQAVLGAGEEADHAPHLVLRGGSPGADDGEDARETRRPPDLAVALDGREAAEHPLDQAARRLGGERPEDLVGMVIEGLGHAARLRVVRGADRAAGAGALPLGVGPHERVLQDGELIGVVSRVVEQELDEPRLDVDAGEQQRLLDRLLPLLARQAGYQVLAAVERLRQPVVAGAVAEEVGAHREHDVDRHVERLRGLEQQAHEEDVVAAAPALGFVPEQLLELVHDEEKRLARRQRRRHHRVDEAMAGAPQRLGAVARRVGAEGLGALEGLGQRLERRAARPHDGGPPAGGGADEIATAQVRQEARLDERRLAAARGPDDGEKVVPAQPLEQRLDLSLPPEEEVAVAGLERAEPGERRVDADGGGEVKRGHEGVGSPGGERGTARGRGRRSSACAG